MMARWRQRRYRTARVVYVVGEKLCKVSLFIDDYEIREYESVSLEDC